MPIIRKLAHFSRLVGLQDMNDFIGADIKPDGLFDAFYPQSIGKLREYCQRNPDFHIVSQVGAMRFNRVVNSAHFFYLAVGSCDESLIFCPSFKLADQTFLKIAEFNIDKTTAPVANGEGRVQIVLPKDLV